MMGKRSKKKLPGEEVFEETTEEEEVDTSAEEDSEKEQRKYKPYFVSDYNRRYPEDSVLVEFVVFVESNDERPIGTRDMKSLSTHMKRFNKGIKYLQSMNKYKIGINFEKPSLANAFLNNVTFLNEYKTKASIPAVGTEISGVITNVPTNLSNSRIFGMLTAQV
ncbi:unnamed protein product [Parnassius apollo]|uniref:(apollo) hypothetical protein n=1 Tax=Parnassius apollo TaxID=110799 RepID=A0A8S3WPQ8_PARAO|nr:unnamed protein product [Parnassius apollo]